MPTDAPRAGAGDRSGTRRPALVASGLLGVQAVLLAVASILLAVAGLGPRTNDRLGAEILALIGLGSAVAVGYLARGVAARRRWARSPTLVLELICLPIAVSVVQSGRWYAGVPLGLSALAVLGLL